MRALSLVLLTAALCLWGYFAVHVAHVAAGPPRPVEVHEEGVSAASLNNEGVRAFRRDRHGDALLFFRRAHDFAPADAVIRANLEGQRARVARRAWLRALVPGTAGLLLLLGLAAVWHAARRARDAQRLGRLRVRSAPLFIPSDAREAILPLRFSEPVRGLLRRHPLTIVWSSARHGKHMKSRPPVEGGGRELRVRLDGRRLERLRRHPGRWRAFLYLGRTQVGDSAASVG